MAHQGTKRRRVDELLALYLAGGDTFIEAARKAGVALRTVHRRMEEQAFREAVVKARGELLDKSAAQLVAASVEAVATLRTLLETGNEQTRLSAARAILENAVRFREHGELAARIAALEGKAVPWG